MAIKRITKGFKAIRDQESFEIQVSVFSMGFYILIKKNGNVLDQKHKTKLKKAQDFVDEHRNKYLKQKYTITDFGEHKVVYNSKTLTFNLSK